MQLENLVRAGAFDALEANRARLFAAAEAILRRAQATAEEKESGQIALFGAASGGAGRRLRLPDMPDWPPMDRLTSRPRRSASTSPRIRSTPMRKALRRLGHDAMRAGGSGCAGGRDAGDARRHGGGAEGARNAHRQPHGLGAHHRCVRLLRGDAVRRGAGARARSAGHRFERARSPPICGRMARRCAITAQDVVALDQAAASAGAAMRIWLRETAVGAAYPRPAGTRGSAARDG